MKIRTWIAKLAPVCLLSLLGVADALAQTPTPAPVPAAPWWWRPEGEVPYGIILIILVIGVIVGKIAGPLLDLVGNGVRQWLQGLGKAGQFRQQYLTSIIGQCRYLPDLRPNIVGGRWEREYAQRSLRLEELFTPLSLGEERASHKRSELFEFDEEQPRWSLKRWPIQRWLVQQWQRFRPPNKPQAGDIGDLIQHHRQLVVLGDPGSGKTTLLRYLALTCARSLRNNRKDNDRRNMVYARLGWRKRPFPILISLNLLSDVIDWHDETKLLAEIVKTLPGELRAIYPPHFFEKQLKRGNCLVLFDGFDELGSRAARGIMARQIADLTHAYSKTTHCFIVSSRIVGYERQLNQYGFHERTVQDLDTDAIHTLIRRAYRAIAIGEALGRSAQEEADLHKRFATRAEQLIRNLDRNAGLQTLTPNPLLLSLIVLVHMVKIELPDERHLLYRDCVEILTEKWQIVRREAAGGSLAPTSEYLVLRDKIEILRVLALTMQKQRGPAGDQILMTRQEMEALIAAQLPNFIASELPANPAERTQACERKAADLLESIRQKSGILIEKGHNSVGDPVVGFSHLTFLEYLAADAIRQQPDELPHLTRNLFNAAWRETLLLYVGMGHAAPVIEAILADPAHTTLTRLLLAGRCLTEKITLEPALQQQVLHGLGAYFLPPTAPPLVDIAALISRLGNEQRYDWLLENFDDLLMAAEAHALQTSLAHLTPDANYPLMQQILLRTMHQGTDMNARQIMGSLLGAIGDPRDLAEMVTIPAGKFTMGGDGQYDGKPVHEVDLDAYQIAKYPVTNAQYQRFVLATDHRPPSSWPDGQPEPRKLNHPVVGVSWHDANLYCAWLSQATGRTFGLPSEAQWEKAARGPSTPSAPSTGSGAGSRGERDYPWGNEPPTAQHCNFALTIGDTTPVGLYPAGASPTGCLDMAGNVWEWTASLYKAYPYDPHDGRENLEDGGNRTLRGGAFVDLDYVVRCAFRRYFGPDYRLFRLGFRVVSSGAVVL